MQILKPTKSLTVLVCLMAIFATNVLTSNAHYSEPLDQRESDHFDPESNYVVIGAFTFKNNAKRFSEYVANKSLNATYELNKKRNLYYVYIFSSKDHSSAVEQVEQIRADYPEFNDAWVFRGYMGDSANEFGYQPKLTKNDQSETERVKSEATDEPTDKVSEIVKKDAQKSDQSVSTDEAFQPEKEPSNEIIKKEGIFNLYFNTVNTQNLREVKGRMQIIDPIRAKMIKDVKSHEMVEVRDPNNGSKQVKVATQIFGFRPVEKIINLDDPVSDSTASYIDTIGDSIIVDFDLQRYRKGDIAVMYNVYFYTNAAIMKSESIYELNSLLDMLEENDNLKVKIHGHTNGNSHGKIKYLDLEDKNFFSLGGNHKEGMGSAKKLSLERAYTIQHWLMDQGINEERMEIKGWGGKSMIHDKHDSQAHKNVRVEIEILEE